MINLKELAKKKELLAGGHRLCAGCGASIAVRHILLASEDPLVVTCATGCLEVATSIYPYTSWKTPWFHSAFENAAATISGIEAMYRTLEKQGKIQGKINFLALAGDGGTYDIGLQALSGAFERGHNFVFVCYDNEAYMNTGIQRSSSTPLGASTTTSPAGRAIPGKIQHRKDMTAIAIAHNIPYVAQASVHNWRDLIQKAKRAYEVEGPAFINVISPCHRGWRFNMEDTIEMARLAVDTRFWPLYEAIEGRIRINYRPREKRPLRDWLKMQGRFAHLFKPENLHILEELQAKVDKDWEKLQSLETTSL